MRKLQSCLSEAETQALANPRLVTKIKSLQTELTTMKRELTESQQLSELRIVEQQEQLEMSMLDKEMSEERAEIAEADLEEVKEKLAMVEVELQVLREGGGVCSLLATFVDLVSRANVIFLLPILSSLSLAG